MYTIPIVKVSYKGNALSARYFDEHPEIQHLYPSKEVFKSQIYLPILKRCMETGEVHTIEISENGVMIDQVKFPL